MTLIPKNWSQFQHYKDRAPPWIKLHRSLLDNIDYHRLTPEAAKALPLIWLIASEGDGLIPNAEELAFRLHIQQDEAFKVLDELADRGFLIEAEYAEQHATHAQSTSKMAAQRNGFSSRHISDAVRRIVWLRDKGACVNCEATENIEYDHKVPVSKGGSSEEDNVQLLCRACNRSKRSGLLRRPLSMRSLETETETEGEAEKRNDRPRGRSVGPDWPADYRQQFWNKYPHKVGKAAALAKLERAAKTGRVTFENLMAGLDRYVRKTDDRPWCNPATWIHQDRWLDQPAAPAERNGAHDGQRHGRRIFGAVADDLIKQFEANDAANRETDLRNAAGENVVRRLPPRQPA